MKKIMLVLAATTMLAFPAAAQQPAQRGSNTLHQAQTVGAGETQQINMRAFHEADKGVLDAIAAVTTNGSHVLNVKFDLRDGKPIYYMHTFNPMLKTFWVGMVDANSGKVMGKGITTPESQLSQDQKDELQALQTTKWSLEDAVRAAEKHSSSDAVDAWLTRFNNQEWAYQIIVDRNGAPEKLRVDAGNGQVTLG